MAVCQVLGRESRHLSHKAGQKGYNSGLKLSVVRSFTRVDTTGDKCFGVNKTPAVQNGAKCSESGLADGPIKK